MKVELRRDYSNLFSLWRGAKMQMWIGDILGSDLLHMVGREAYRIAADMAIGDRKQVEFSMKEVG